MVVDGSATVPIPTYIPDFSPIPTMPADPVINITIDNVTYNNVTFSPPSTRQSTTYRSFVTDGLGFYKIRNVDVPPVPFTYEDRILNINQGDSIIWINDADAATITIISDQSLWNDKVGQIKVGATINYKFDEPGTYTFHVKGTSMRQTIMVGDTGLTAPTVTSTPIPTEDTPSPTPTEYTPSPTYTKNKPFPTPTNDFPTSIDTSISYQNDTNTSLQNMIPINLPIKITTTTIASMIVAMLSIYITYKTGKK